MSVYEIPLTPSPQQFTIQLAGVTYTMRVRWIDSVTGGWCLDIGDADNNPILSGVMLVTGADLLEQYAYLGFGGKLGVQTDNDLNAVPTYTNLGVNSHVYFVTD